MTKEELLAQIADLKRQIARMGQHGRQHRRNDNPRSRFYVTDYSKLTPVKGGFVHPGILAMYNKEVLQ